MDFGKDSLPELEEETRAVCRSEMRRGVGYRVGKRLSETEREQLKKAGCIRKHIFFRTAGGGFRYSALCLAKELQLTGWVKNLTDGREAELQGQANCRLVCGAYQSAQDCRRVCGRGGPRTCYEEGFEVR
ncbi:MAG: acylphosphatase [Gallintestinimicrobium sp.]